jgi:hypothetical protein
MTLSNDAIIFGIGYLNGPKARLSFGGQGATMMITARASKALAELLVNGYAAETEPTDSIPGREFYKGTMKDPSLAQLAREAGINIAKPPGVPGLP